MVYHSILQIIQVTATNQEKEKRDKLLISHAIFQLLFSYLGENNNQVQ